MKTLIKTIIFLSGLLIMGCSNNDKATDNKTQENQQIEEQYNDESDNQGDSSLKKYGYCNLRNLKEFKETEFVPTIENINSDNKNSIYSAALILGWERIKKELKNKIIVSATNSNDFLMINSSICHQNTLKSDEYKLEISTSDGIIVKSYFDKLLPFIYPLQNLKKPLIFHSKKVKTFGIEDFDDMLAGIVNVYYFENNDRFIFGIKSEIGEHEIIFAKGINMNGSLKSAYNEIEKLRQIGDNQKKNKIDMWKYSYTNLDKLSIPHISFNIENNYSGLENQSFKTADNVVHKVFEAYQKVSFNLDQNGVAIQNIAMMLVDSAGLVDKSKPKQLILDKPFVFFLKRKDAKYPYFAMKIRNAELMIKKENKK